MADNTTILVPPPNTKGLYTLYAPFDQQMVPNELYTCAAIRRFEDIENNGRNVFSVYYEPFGLTEQQCQSDRAAGHFIVTLLSTKYPPLYVPTSFIKSYPNLNSKQYNQVILTLSLGPLPDDVILDSAMDAAANAVSDFLGVTPEVHIGIMPLSDAVTPEQHETREANRLAAIANRTTDYARLAEEQAKNAQLSQRLAIAEKMLKDNGLLP
ncbi:hypothetical protein AVT69_gp183 [Pseudomonas phage PhiPA3]|uniref:Uncharacterized protein 185 n=1 Tax=Pseudomonas phage PhiPA3 TaxID=998086 RepID=F8SK55_BPPA3|nr:hypothetical protein AVT69_gp183 [Pseudomonas phage PhiPA3]AEH03608.1 hypothetical protein [Pseudomonas phage PhiPA3]